MRCLLLPCAVLAALLAFAPAARADRVRGVTLSTHTNGSDWAGDGIVPAFAEMKRIGAGWVAIHPYAGIGADGSVHYRPLDPANPPDWLTRPIAEAHAQGLRILIKPHLAYWGSPFSWRGEIRFDTEEQWERFFADYRAWVVDVARVTRDADGFAVGTELDSTVFREADWRETIAAVRAVTDLPLTYAANWHAYREVPFWDAVDVIGIQAYFPVVDHPDPTPPELAAGWHARMSELRDYSLEHDRYIVFTELGYNRSFDAAREPWAHRTDGEEAEPFQEACLRAALEAIEREPRVIGAFLWKWFPEPYPVGRNFQLATPALTRTIADVWR